MAAFTQFWLKTYINIILKPAAHGLENTGLVKAPVVYVRKLSGTKSAALLQQKFGLKARV